MADNTPLPLISVIVPIYNAEKYIEQCVRSIFGQTYSRLEIIFVNDGTPDGSIEIIRKVAADYPGRKGQVTIIDNGCNKGSTVSRSVGIKNCIGDYVLCIDSDDYIEANMVSILAKTACDGDCDIVAASFYINTFDKETAIGISDTRRFFDINHVPIDTLHFSLCNKIIKRSILDRLPDIPDANCWDDLALSCRAFALSQKAVAINMPLYHYRVGENSCSLTSQDHKKRLQDQITVARFVEDWFIGNNLDAQYAPFLKNMKFSAKIKYLRGGKRDFAAWKHTFPETNRGILQYRHIPLPYRLLFFIADLLPAALCQWVSDLFRPTNNAD